MCVGGGGKGEQWVTLEAKGSGYRRWMCTLQKALGAKGYVDTSVPTKPSFHLFQLTFWETHPAGLYVDQPLPMELCEWEYKT